MQSQILPKKHKDRYITGWGLAFAWVWFIGCIISMVYVNPRPTMSWTYFLQAFILTTFSYLLFKMILALSYRPAFKEPEEGRKVSVIISSYNESADSVEASIECLLVQDYPIHEILFVDDGSSDLSAYHAIQKMSEKFPHIVVHRFEENRGKRYGQCWGIRNATGEFLMFVDSDGYIFSDAVRELLKVFQNRKVNGCVGHINARNRDHNFLTWYQDVLYEGAFRVGRGAESVTNSVMVCSGALSMYRRDAIIPHIDLFENETFMKKSIMTGDDRRLTAIALMTGRTKYQSTAKCVTDVPTSLKKFFKQQVRWSKSFFIGTIKTLPLARKNPFIALWLICEGVFWIFFGISLIRSLLVSPSNSLLLMLVIYKVGYLVLTSFMKNVFYILKHPLLFLMSPIFAIFGMLLLYPQRVVALFTLRNTGWGTR